MTSGTEAAVFDLDDATQAGGDTGFPLPAGEAPAGPAARPARPQRPASIADRIKAQQREALAAYKRFVFATVENPAAEVDDLAVVQIIQAAGRTVEQFESDVRRIEQRAGALKRLEESEAQRAEASELDDEISQALAEHQELEAECRERLKVSQEKLNEVANRKSLLVMGASVARSDARALLEAGADPSINEEIRRLENELQNLRNDGNRRLLRSDLDEAARMEATQKRIAEIRKLEGQIETLRQSRYRLESVAF